ncbi:alpha/beta hydrolase [Georgenia sp. EYE_87]|uniref:alpha/beta fold hydrolase n=1 Tax=Georgenia sp. EYE_87 TaxID=2853448 RepID=UPI0020037798|nr:alpha/beta fold hydrolase [Georgenia sp. EYE_87]MCK6211888.1 alpha/beta hydrolase [Georgenia sp. EYE_87]
MELVEGTLTGGLPYLAFGGGPALVVLAGLEAENVNPTGAARARELRGLRAYARRHRVHVVRRPAGLPAGVTMADLADLHARALADRFGEPVDVLGSSTGGSVALQLAVDHPEAVRRLVLLSAACRLSDPGRAAQRRLAERTAAGDYGRGIVELAPVMAATAAGTLVMRAGLRLAGPAMTPADPTDLLRTIEAEDAFDVCDRLGAVQAPTLVVAGARDGYYSPELFRRTAAGVPGGRLRLYPRMGHVGPFMSRRVRADILRFLAGEHVGVVAPTARGPGAD